MKISNLDSVESISHSIANEGGSTYSGIPADQNSDHHTSNRSLNLKKQPDLKLSKVTGRYPNIELVKIDLCVSIEFENCQIPSQKFYGNLDVIKEELQTNEIPKIKESNPVAISLLVKDEANLSQYKLAIREIAKILNYYLIKRVKQQLVKIPNQLLTTEFSATILHFRHEFLVEILVRGEIPFQTFNSSKCVRASDLLKYIKKLEKTRKKAFYEMRQCEY